MKKIIMVIIVVAIVILAIVAVAYTVLSDSIWEDDTDFGNWGQEIILEYADGSSEPLKPLSLFSLMYDGKTLAAIRYRLSAKASGVGYDYAEIDLESYSLQITITGHESPPFVHEFTVNGFVTYDIGMNNEWYTITNERIDADLFDPNGETLPIGLYTITITPTGSIFYRGFMVGRTGWGDVMPATLPSIIYFDIDKDSSKTLSVEVENDIGTEHSDWSWSLVAAYQTEIHIPQVAISCVGSNVPEVLFASIADNIECVFQYHGSTLLSWCPGRPHNTLDHIWADVTVYISVYADCMFIIESCD